MKSFAKPTAPAHPYVETLKVRISFMSFTVEAANDKIAVESKLFAPDDQSLIKKDAPVADESE